MFNLCTKKKEFREFLSTFQKKRLNLTFHVDEKCSLMRLISPEGRHHTWNCENVGNFSLLSPCWLQFQKLNSPFWHDMGNAKASPKVTWKVLTNQEIYRTHTQIKLNFYQIIWVSLRLSFMSHVWLFSLFFSCRIKLNNFFNVIAFGSLSIVKCWDTTNLTLSLRKSGNVH